MGCLIGFIESVRSDICYAVLDYQVINYAIGIKIRRNIVLVVIILQLAFAADDQRIVIHSPCNRLFQLRDNLLRNKDLTADRTTNTIR